MRGGKVGFCSSWGNPWLFFAVTYGLTWAFWIPAALSRQSLKTPMTFALYTFGGLFGKALPAILMPYLAYGREGWRGYWRRVLGWRKISLAWWAVALLACPLFSALGILTDILTGGSLPSFATAARFLSRPLTILPFALLTLIYGPLPEELGWCGYELDRLQTKYSALKSALIVGLFWALWHLPLFFIAGTWHHDELLGSPRLWTYVPGTVAIQILQTWMFNNTGHSALTAVLIHFMLNFTGEFLNVTNRPEVYRDLWTVAAAIAVCLAWGARTLTKKPFGRAHGGFEMEFMER